MGVDCHIFDGKEYQSLDRWYVFEDHITGGREYTKEQIIESLDTLWDFVGFLKDSTWDERFLSDKDYYKKWIAKAKEFVNKSESDSFIFYTDTNLPDEFYEEEEKKVNFDYKNCKHDIVRFGVGVNRCKECDVLIVSLQYISYLQMQENRKKLAEQLKATVKENKKSGIKS